MTQEEKQLLIKDLCGRLPYGVICETYLGDKFVLKDTELSRENTDRRFFQTWCVNEIKPYLRPMSSMTEEEAKELASLIRESWEFYDYFSAHHFDYRGLIEKGLALEAPEDMYK